MRTDRRLRFTFVLASIIEGLTSAASFAHIIPIMVLAIMSFVYACVLFVFCFEQGIRTRNVRVLDAVIGRAEKNYLSLSRRKSQLITLAADGRKDTNRWIAELDRFIDGCAAKSKKAADRRIIQQSRTELISAIDRLVGDNTDNDDDERMSPMTASVQP